MTFMTLSVVLVKHRKGFGRKPLFIAINSLLLTFGATRAVYLLLDPYESKENGVEDPKRLTLLLFGIAYPCLTFSFSLIHLAFLEVTKIKIGPGKLQNVKFLSGVIVIHFVIVFTAETSSSIKPETGRAFDRVSVVLHSLGLASLRQLHLQRMQSDQPRGKRSRAAQCYREKRGASETRNRRLARPKWLRSQFLQVSWELEYAVCISTL
ncbi:hypothetical protein OS493_007693 [Desmophyllum pertusum]|uniref:Proline-rich transmembrane protein 3/4 domain-containing protein n=1 Tax=Desmophyllum pertusum TaxID=174260 RepID=A0A9X0CM74_9CNID|nr:hypothetical protein OS493_007693 [Desmophyllum pertusum]